MFRSAEVKAILKAKLMWRVVRGYGVASSTSHRVEMKVVENCGGNITGGEYARDSGCSLILQGLEEIPFSCVIAHQDDQRKMWEPLYQRYIASKTFSKAILHSCLARIRYSGQAVKDFFAK